MLNPLLEHAQVAADVDQGGSLIVEFDFERARRRHPDLGNRSSCVVVDVLTGYQLDLVGNGEPDFPLADQRLYVGIAVDRRHIGLRVPRNSTANIRETDLAKFLKHAGLRDCDALGRQRENFLNAILNALICFECRGIATIGLKARFAVGHVCRFARC